MRCLAGSTRAPQRDPVEDERLRIDRRGGGQHDGAAGDLESPDAAAFARRVELREQRDAVAARQHLERHDQRLARDVPVEIDLGAVDRNAGERIIEIDDDALVHQDLAVEHMRNAVGSDIGADARRERQIGLELTLAHAHGEHEILGGDFLRLDVDDAVALLLARRHGGAHRPGPLDVLRSQRHGDAAALGPHHAEIDIGERPLLAVALIVDGEIAAFEADLGEIAPIQSAGIEALDPGQQHGEVGNAVAGHRGRAHGRRGRRAGSGWRSRAERGGAFEFGSGRRRTGVRGCGVGRRGDERALVAAGKDRDLAVGLDPHRHFRADKAQPFGANAAGQQAGARDPDFRLRRARHHGAFGIAHDDVADAQRRASAGVPLELSAADLDVMARAEILLDRRGEPRRREIEFDRAAGEPPPQRDHGDQDEAAERTADEDELAHARSPQAQSHEA